MQPRAIGPFLLAACCCTAQAQPVVYGIVDVAVEHLTNVGLAGGGLTRVPGVTGSVPSRLGFRAAEDLGDGLRAVFTIEQGFAPDAGSLNQGGRAFGRQAFVGLSGNWGTLTLGRQYTMLVWSLFDADILGPNMHGMASLDAYIANARADNAVAYRGSFAGFTVGATYSAGRDAVNAGPSPAGTNCPGESATDKKACREWSVLGKYDTNDWGVAFAVDELRGGPGAFAGLSSSAMKDTRVTANGYVKFGQAKLGAGLVRRDNDGNPATPKSDLWFLGASYLVNPLFMIDGEAFQLRYKNSGNRSTIGVARMTYFLSKRTALYASLGHIDNAGTLNFSVSGGAGGSNPMAGGAQTALASGIRHTF